MSFKTNTCVQTLIEHNSTNIAIRKGKGIKISSYKYDGLSDVMAGMESGLAGALTKMSATFAAARKELDLSGADQFKRTTINSKLVEAAKEDLAELVAQERGIVEAALADQRKSWERDAEVNSTKYAQQSAAYEWKMRAMTAEEIGNEAHAVLSGQRIARPQELDILSAALKTTDPNLHSMLRKSIPEQHLDEPWRFTPEGRVISTYLETVKASEKQGYSVPVKGEDGHSYNVMLSDILGNLDE
jgi:hypothetical protein